MTITGLIARILGMLVLTGGLVLGASRLSNIPTTRAASAARSVPELDSNALGSGITILVGGLLLLHERRRKD